MFNRKPLTLVFVVAVATTVVMLGRVTSSPIAQPQDDAEMEAIQASCAKELNVDVESADKALTDGVDVTEDMRCYAKCNLQAMGIIDAAGNLDDEALLGKFSSPGFLEKAIFREMLATCKKVTENPQSCGYGYDIIRCMMMEARKLAEQFADEMAAAENRTIEAS